MTHHHRGPRQVYRSSSGIIGSSSRRYAPPSESSSPLRYVPPPNLRRTDPYSSPSSRVTRSVDLPTTYANPMKSVSIVSTQSTSTEFFLPITKDFVPNQDIWSRAVLSVLCISQLICAWICVGYHIADFSEDSSLEIGLSLAFLIGGNIISK